MKIILFMWKDHNLLLIRSVFHEQWEIVIKLKKMSIRGNKSLSILTYVADKLLEQFEKLIQESTFSVRAALYVITRA